MKNPIPYMTFRESKENVAAVSLHIFQYRNRQIKIQPYINTGQRAEAAEDRPFNKENELISVKMGSAEEMDRPF